MRHLLALAVIGLAMTSCRSFPRPPFPLEEYLALPTVEEDGAATVYGEAFRRTLGGDTITAAGSEVMLNPVTSYSEWWYEHAYLKRRPVDPPDPRINDYCLRYTAGADGDFEFTNVPAGDYFLTASIYWSGGQYTTYGGPIVKRITLRPGERKRVILTR